MGKKFRIIIIVYIWGSSPIQIFGQASEGSLIKEGYVEQYPGGLSLSFKAGKKFFLNQEPVMGAPSREIKGTFQIKNDTIELTGQMKTEDGYDITTSRVEYSCQIRPTEYNPDYGKIIVCESKPEASNQNLDKFSFYLQSSTRKKGEIVEVCTITRENIEMAEMDIGLRQRTEEDENSDRQECLQYEKVTIVKKDLKVLKQCHGYEFPHPKAPKAEFPSIDYDDTGEMHFETKEFLESGTIVEAKYKFSEKNINGTREWVRIVSAPVFTEDRPEPLYAWIDGSCVSTK